ncbi:hypothetical protein ARMSODRAFT_1027155 [Armillaria solidipes]|uniref:Uncharacterized protein n=1 Tax=Armillaria solidipes TaxID=1076256 RepID=A0A2H3B784_9AGAR|nr:hypothetical protein ARMSODRAFT_1027155 [Armillaria solidipes]
MYPFAFSEDDLDRFTPHERLARTAHRMCELRADITKALEWANAVVGPVPPSELSTPGPSPASSTVRPRPLVCVPLITTPLDLFFPKQCSTPPKMQAVPNALSDDDDDYLPDEDSDGEFSSGSEMDWDAEGDLAIELVIDDADEYTRMPDWVRAAADLPDLSFGTTHGCSSSPTAWL